MDLKSFLKITSLKSHEVSFFYKSRVDEKPIEVRIIQSNNKKGLWEIIRESQIQGRTEYAGFFTSFSTLLVKTSSRFLQVDKFLKELNEID
jgi:hypothetical protein